MAADSVVDTDNGGRMNMVNSTKTKGNVRLDSSSSATPDDICITGIAGSYPDSRSTQELADNLFNKRDLVSSDGRRWKQTNLELPKRTGKIWDVEKFDADFFGINFTEAHFVDPMQRILMEKVYESIIDAGINPEELRNTRTGVFVACILIETDRIHPVHCVLNNDFGVTAGKRSVLAHRISEWLKLSATSYSVDAACSSTYGALDNAFFAMKSGDCDMALVCGVNLCLLPTSSLAYARLGVLSYDGSCKSFDESANGYVRSECIGACFLQRAKDSRRIYAKVVHVKNYCDGFKPEGIHYPSCRMQTRLLEDFYSQSGVDPAQIEFVEAHAAGTQAGDPVEANAICNVFSKNRKGPLLVGSVKSNLGHCEASAGICSISKAVIAYNTGALPPNIHYKTPRRDIPALVDGTLQVVDEPTPWNRGYYALSGSGFGGSNAHTLLENISKSKVNQGLPADNLPRLVSFSNRTENGLKNMINHLENKPIDVDEVRLWHAIFRYPERRNTYRGYILLGSNPKRGICIAKGMETKKVKRPKVCFKYSALLANWTVIAQELMSIRIFAKSLNGSFSTLETKHNVHIFLKNTAIARQYTLLGSVAVCIALTDVLKAVGITPDYFVGEDIGELCSAYADKSLTAEQTILVAYECNKALEAMFANNNVSIKQVKGLLNCNLIKDLKNNLQQLIPDTATSSERWLTQSSRSEFTLSEYLIHSLANPVSPADTLSDINSDAVVIEIGFSDKVLGIPIVENDADNIENLLKLLGNLYLRGLDLNLAVLYPDVPFPVSQGTPMLSHLVGWNHDDNWTVVREQNDKCDVRERDILIDLNAIEHEFLKGYTIDGRVIYPATGYLVLVWDIFATLTARWFNNVSVVFEDVYFHRATHIPKSGIVEFNVNIFSKTGQFEITENEITVVSGRIYEKPCIGKNFRILYDTDEPVNVKFNHDLNTKDVYKELNFRGYQYKGLFRGIRHCNVLRTKGSLAWNHNWVTFLDTLLQVQLINNDSRSLYVPTRIEQLAVDVDLHSALLANCLQDSITESLLQFKYYPQLQVIRAGGAQLRRIHTTAISKKQPPGIPVVYEKSLFVPNFSENISIQQAMRADIQMIIENFQIYKCKAVELVDELYKTYNLQPIIEIVGSVMADLLLIKEELVVLSDEALTLPSNITISNNKMSTESDALLFIGANLMSRKKIFEECKKTIKPGCFILSRECERPEQKSCPANFDVLTMYGTGSEYVILLREKSKCINKRKHINISTNDGNFTWIEEVKVEINKNAKIILYTDNEPMNGLLGLVNCLRKEPGGENISGFLIADPTAPPFNPVLPFYKTQLDLGLGVNVFKNGQWGTYRHLLIEQIEQIPANHAYLKPTVAGDVSSLKFLEGPLHHEAVSRTRQKKIVHVYCSALNFRDVLTTMGRVAVESVARTRLDQECVQGIEISGKLENGIRIMSMTRGRGITNLAESDDSLLWPFPDEWTFTEAATVPVAYATVYAALVLMGKMRKGESILIHAGTGAVGQAAINVALHHGLEVFTTVGTPAKRAFIMRMFPQISDSHIGSSRDISFEEMIRRETKGEGVDLVLNSLAEEMLQASAKCLKSGGRFLEIGKDDITRNTEIETCFLNKGVSFFGVTLDYLHEPEAAMWRKNIKNLITRGIKEGAVRPISYCVFEKSEIETAFRYISAGKHIGKVVIKIRPDDPVGAMTKPTFYPIKALPRYTCHREFVYVIVGGLGGFGLELADWLVMRGARKIVFSSRRGVSNGYQALRLKFWQDYEAEIIVSTADVASEAGCQELLQLASSMGTVRAIFNLAVILRDAIFNNQTQETFRESFAPKAQATINLDKFSRVLCPELKEFVTFSSVSCGRGNTGLSSYGYFNSFMERVCEIRKDNGLPALAIQWGAICHVGLEADMQEENVQMEIGGTLQQRITSCLDAFAILLRQNGSSIVVAEKRTGSSGSRNVIDVIANIMGITDLKTISRQVPLSEMGMDSVMAVEIKQTLERDYELFFNAQEIRMLTFAKLMEAASTQSAEDATKKTR